MCLILVDVETIKQKKKKKLKSEKLGEIQKEGNFAVKPSDKISKLDTSQWPLLLKVSFFSTIILLSQNFHIYIKVLEMFLRN